MHVLNLKPQNSDERDYKLRLEQTMLSLPLRIDLRGECPPIFNQGELGSCTANAGVAARMMLGKIRTLLSRLYLYYKERELDGTINEDSGATMRTVCKALQRYGVCRELMWPYIIDNFAETPGKMAEENAKKYKITAYRTFDCDNTSDTIEQTKRYIAVKRLPVLTGITVFESFETEKTTQTGVIPLPDTLIERELGGHALLIVGYDDAKRWFVIRNSWGRKWGDKGYGYMPYEYVERGYAFDFWVLE